MFQLMLLVTLTMWSCFNKSKAIAPKRHPNIPSNATWAGGVDGGEWYQVTSSAANNFRIKIYNDFTGELEAEGPFVVHQGCSVNLDSATVVENLSGFDGETIHLRIIHNDKYCSLVPATSLAMPH